MTSVGELIMKCMTPKPNHSTEKKVKKYEICPGYFEDKIAILFKDYYNLTTTQEPNTEILHRLDSRMIGVLGEADLAKCQELLPRDQSFVTGFPLLLLQNNSTISHAKSGVAATTTTTTSSTSSSSSTSTTPTYTTPIPPTTSWTLMTFSPNDTPDIQKERVLKIVATVNSMVRDSLIQQKLEAHLNTSEKITIPNVYYKTGDLLIEGEIYLTLQRLSFIQKCVKDLNLKILKKNKDNYSFSIDTISIYECKQSELKCVKHHQSVILSSQGKTPDIKSSYLFCFLKSEIAEITNNIIRVITESQDIVDQVVMESQHHGSSNGVINFNGNSGSVGTGGGNNDQNKSKLSTSNLSDSEFLLVDEIENFNEVGSSNEQDTYIEEEEDIHLTANSYQTKLDDQPTHHPTKINFKVNSDILTNDDMLWVCNNVI
ncbi:TLDc domain-containing protein [Heterostelium album PN500]|uniref:TLDc domain-containing protein n=1 Tax=Heterostelium pallidum (strain ATCC 26659 / Pp 5 / PN500) TaxID=670386 RepID=D3B187_HETP5|nr:TLDc domain-containing protein [Heterostelium album PN500]EFA85061.1 TLDc domain-containing protein [Heterostelium album PN500]|eukprot:XP_020437171.1 TLDc domain-containing protein [Heterostelium album PN500]